MSETKHTPEEESVFLAVRENKQHSYLDITTASGSMDNTRRLAAKDDSQLKSWAKDNPVIGYASCRVVVTAFQVGR